MINLGKLITTGEVNTLLTDSGFLITEVSVDQTDIAHDLLKVQGWVHQCDIVDDKLRVSLGKDHISEMVQMLVQNDIQVSAVIPRTSLEDLFLSKVGTESVIV